MGRESKKRGAVSIIDSLCRFTVQQKLTQHNIVKHPLLLLSHLAMSRSLWPHGLQRSRLPRPSPSAAVCSDFMSVESVMPSNHLILYHPLFLLPSVFPSIKKQPYSNEIILKPVNLGKKTHSQILNEFILAHFPSSKNNFQRYQKGKIIQLSFVVSPPSAMPREASDGSPVEEWESMKWRQHACTGFMQSSLNPVRPFPHFKGQSVRSVGWN